MTRDGMVQDKDQLLVYLIFFCCCLHQDEPLNTHLVILSLSCYQCIYKPLELSNLTLWTAISLCWLRIVTHIDCKAVL